MLINGDSLIELKKLPENSVDSIVCDPPYGLSFMGKKWDYDVPTVELWKEAIRVLKPGGHLLSFAGSRTYHRMAVNIEDAGFDIRDQIMWVYGVGFPKSHNIYKTMQKKCTCGTMEQYDNENTKREVRPLRDSNVQETINPKDEQGEVLQSELSEQSTHETMLWEEPKEGSQNGEEPSMERGSNLQEGERELQGSDLSKMSDGVSTDGEERRLHNATQASDGSTPEQITDENGSSTLRRPQSEQQQDREPCPLCDKWGTQKIRRTAGEIAGFGTALKPAHEPIVVARKPFKGTVANNVLEHGTGGINIDGCRVEPQNERDLKELRSERPSERKGNNQVQTSGGRSNRQYVTGRFPANFIHDGSDEVVGLFPETHGHGSKKHTGSDRSLFGNGKALPTKQNGGEGGSAARFFYCAKASKKDRNEGLPEGQTSSHPTVKPTKLMQYLVRLVTPPQGTVLDPFMGSGSTGKACKLEGFDFIGIELDEEYCKIAEARIDAC